MRSYSARITYQFLCLPCFVLLDNLFRKAGYVLFYCVFHINIVMPRVLLHGPRLRIEVSRFEQRLHDTKTLMMNIGGIYHILTHSSVTSPALRFLSEIRRALRASETSASDMDKDKFYKRSLTKQMIGVLDSSLVNCKSLEACVSGLTDNHVEHHHLPA